MVPDAWTPPDAAAPEPEVRLAVLLAPHRRIEGGGSVFMPRETPAGALVGQKIHLKNPSTPARAKHRRLLEITVLLDDVQAPATKLLREIAGNENGPVWRNKPSAKALPDLDNNSPERSHAARLRVSSMRPSSGSLSPNPVLPAMMRQWFSSPSQISSMLARLKVTAA